MKKLANHILHVVVIAAVSAATALYVIDTRGCVKVPDVPAKVKVMT